jgi:hypothetical protein
MSSIFKIETNAKTLSPYITTTHMDRCEKVSPNVTQGALNVNVEKNQQRII